MLPPRSAIADGHEHAAEEAAQADQEDQLSMYRAYLGKWSAVAEGKATDVIPEAYQVTEQWESREVLGGRAIETRGTTSVGDEKTDYIWLFTYDEREGKHVGFYHDSTGINSKMYGDWSPKTKKMTWTLADPDGWDMAVTVVDDLSDPSQIQTHMKIVLEDGTLIMDQAGVAKPDKDK